MDNQIRIGLQNHSLLMVDCNAHQSQELRDYFSFFVPGYRFMPAFKARRWDGKIKLYNMVTKTLPVGLYKHLKKFCADRFYPLQLMDNDQYGHPEVKNKVDHPSLMKELKDYGAPFEPRGYQYDAIVHGIEQKRALLLSPTGSGKSFIIYNLMRWVQERTEGKTLIIVPTTSLVEQMYKDFEDYGYDVQNNVHRIYSGKEKVTDKRIIVSTWQSIYRFGAEWFEQFDSVFGDEVHLFKAKSLATMMDKCVNASYRWGTTGTLDGTETNKLVLEGLFGPTFTVTTTVKLMESQTLAELDISVLLLRYHNDICEMMADKSYQEEIDYIVTNPDRLRFVTNLATSQEGNTLVLFQFVEKHGKLLYDQVKEVADDDRKVFYVSGEVDAEVREEIRGIVEKQKNAIIVASLGTFSTGVNIKNLHNIIFASPSKSQVKVLQSIGRGLRKSEDGRTTVLFDLMDDMHYRQKKNYTLIHAIERMKIYKKEEFDFEIFEVKL